MIRRLAGWLGLGLLCCSVEADTVTNVYRLTRTTITTNTTKTVVGDIYPNLIGTYVSAPDYSLYTQVYTNLNGTGTLATCDSPGNILFSGSIVWYNSESNAYTVYSELEPPPNTGTAYVVSSYTYTTNVVAGYTSTVSVVEGMAIRSYSFSP